MPNSNEYMNAYMKERWEKRRLAAIEQLGGKYVQCGSNINLEFDHVDPSEKSFTIAKASSFSEVRFQAELIKCQLLCKSCHELKHDVGKQTHGTLSSYRYCKCDECKKAKSEWNRKKYIDKNIPS